MQVWRGVWTLDWRQVQTDLERGFGRGKLGHTGICGRRHGVLGVVLDEAGSTG